MAPLKPTILAVDDEQDMLKTYASILKNKYLVLTAASGKEALNLIGTEPVSLVLLDLRMPKQDGIQALKKIKETDPDLEVIMVTASKDIVSAVEAMKLGAYDYIAKPFEVKELLAIIEKALEKSALVKENLYLKETLKETFSYCNLIGKSLSMNKLFETIEKVAKTNSRVLISGESGSGKELVARAIHTQSLRKDKPFVALNCAAIPENLFESELFGHERGSFTGAMERKIGKFELANGGTLFLDEIGCMPAAMQAKLLRVLEHPFIERLGSEKSIEVDVRVVSATNIDFQKHIDEGKFRHDLYYRLNVIPIAIPSLKDRKEDIPLLIDYFLEKFNRTLNKSIKGFSPEAMESLLNYNWPGNVRELQNLIERLAVLANSNLISLEEIPLISHPSHSQINIDTSQSLQDNLANFEKQTINKVLLENNGNVSRAAKTLGLARTTLNNKIKNYKII